MIRLNLGCGQSPTDGWQNYDNSFSIKLASRPMLYRVFSVLSLINSSQKSYIEWIRRNSIMFCDVTKRLPFKSDTCEAIYSCHMFEHLSQAGASNFLKEAFRVLKPDGVIRLNIPDLRNAVDDYLVTGDADRFMFRLKTKAPPLEGFLDKIKILIAGYRHHQWMYDGPSLIKLLKSHGFSNVQVCAPGHTLIKNKGNLNLYERSEISIIVEGVKHSK